MKEKEKQYMTPEQLAEIEEQLNLLNAEKEMGDAELRKLNEENAKLVGHQNLKQKIRYHYQVKEENIQLRQEKQILQTKLAKAEAQLKSLQKELGVLMPVDSNKENISNSKLSLGGSHTFQTPNHHLLITKKKVPLSVTPANLSRSLMH
jgi:hypothetical protein